jgi:hypothetical protein
MAERNRCHVLHTRQDLGEIHGLMVHERFKLMVNGTLITTYESDFSYTDSGETATTGRRRCKERAHSGLRRLSTQEEADESALFGIDIVEVS